jgi:hypothetical protein
MALVPTALLDVPVEIYSPEFAPMAVFVDVVEL